MEQPVEGDVPTPSSSGMDKSWKTADEHMDAADNKQQTKRSLEDQENDRPAKRPKSGGGEVYEETREWKTGAVTYPHFVGDVGSADTHHDDRHHFSSSEWGIFRVNAMKDVEEIRDENSDDNSSNSDSSSDDEEFTESNPRSSQRSGTLSPRRSPRDTTNFPGTNTGLYEPDESPNYSTSHGDNEQPYNGTSDSVIVMNDGISGDRLRTPSPRLQPLILSSPPSISPISPPISLSIPSLSSSTSTSQPVSPSSRSWPSTSPPPVFWRWNWEYEHGWSFSPEVIPSEPPYTSPKEGEEEEEEEEEQHWISEADDGEEWEGIQSEEEEDEEEEEWEGFPDEEQEGEGKGDDELKEKKKKRKVKKFWWKIVFWRRIREEWEGIVSEAEDWEEFSDEEESGDNGLENGDLEDGDLEDGDLEDGDLEDGDLEDGDSEDRGSENGGSSPAPLASSTPPFHLRLFIRRNLRPRRRTNRTVADG